MPEPVFTDSAEKGSLRALVICPDAAMREQVIASLDRLTDMIIPEAILAEYPSAPVLMRAIRGCVPDVVVVSFERFDVALTIIRYLEQEAEGLPIIGIHTTCTADVLRAGMRAGVRGVLAPPFPEPAWKEALGDIRHLVERAPANYAASGHVYTFLPSKPGVGATTLAMNISAAAARIRDTKVLLTDLDLANGLIRFLLRLPKEVSIVDAMLRSPDMDENLWPQLIVESGGLDLLHSGSANPQTFIEPGHIQCLLDFARRSYGLLMFDLSGNMEQHSIRVMEESKKIFMICTPEASSLQLARERLLYLKSIRLDSRVAILLNRVDQRMAISPEKIEDLLGVPILGSFPNAYRAVTRATGAATFVDESTRLGKQVRAFAETLVAAATPSGQPDSKTAGFLDRLRQAVPALLQSPGVEAPQ